ncbi:MULTISPECIES: ABC transporter substrate-binding protein [unclassified Bradyrhizobium]|uniref:ABC transporter substrate-binding protein n=1 Tax=unclassified Bradyrhizobium TaxID=2631580 RepID=UPI001BA5FC72|nr:MULTISPECIES: ABC transporter substrate-binding protein [unclassified Bradyrhizobium]MBR1204558.1 ABC transporter substrate-binding protein [Bradyrhizobium sp. AUGA SZCCT0124]MBR1309556.1 ABC transporter substrate-binding protein [Bradyrhizobium sp. AUGA SZCCT0051]MBR1339697.1 ABC transporter substrate-binding protein [Bradyrhizobium sp. AUGA SZCCT0105]MBR1354304.1 ABC transporter substrate-binding protein [Bradyrhizobium sp. AUGA SZCCT0045]
MRSIAAALTAVLCLAAVGSVSAQVSGDVVRIGVINDMSGLYSDLGGEGSVEAARLAIEDFGPTVLGKKIELMSADHQNKPDIASGIVRRWIDENGVDLIADGGNSATALAIQAITREKKRIFVISGPGSSDLTGKQCSPYGFHFTYSTYAEASAVTRAMLKKGADTWFFLTADYAFGHALERDASSFVTTAGSKVVGSVRHPLGASDLSSFLLQAQNSKAKVIALANAGGDTVNSLKQASEFGIGKSADQNIVALLMLITDVHSLGLEAAQGIIYATSFSWTQNEATRTFGHRFMARRRGQAPTMIQAGVYSGVMHYLKAVQAAGTDDPGAVAATMRKLPVNDFMTQNAQIREDGQMMRSMYLVQAKSPSESREPWDYEKVIATISPDEAWRPLAEGGCPFVTKAQ